MSDGQGGLPSYKDLENAVLDGTAAIHCLTHERDHLRSRVELQERELVSLRATNDDLRRQLMTIGESYMKFAASCISPLTSSAVVGFLAFLLMRRSVFAGVAVGEAVLLIGGLIFAP